MLHLSPGFVQMPQLGLQQTSPTLQVLSPQGALNGVIGGLSHGSCEQVSPEGTQMPQLRLQHTSVALQVLGPQVMLMGMLGAPQR